MISGVASLWRLGTGVDGEVSALYVYIALGLFVQSTCILLSYPARHITPIILSGSSNWLK